MRVRGRRVSWRNAPAYRRDWIGIWKRGDTDLYNDYLTFVYTNATVSGSTTIGKLPPGRYVARLMKDDGYAELARVPFTVGSSSTITTRAAPACAQDCANRTPALREASWPHVSRFARIQGKTWHEPGPAADPAPLVPQLKFVPSGR